MGIGTRALEAHRARGYRVVGQPDYGQVEQFLAQSAGVAKADLAKAAGRIAHAIEYGEHIFGPQVSLPTMAALADRLEQLSK